MKNIFVDTSGWYSLVDKDDPDHPAVVAWFKANTYPLITTNYTFSETVTLILNRLGHSAAVAFGGGLMESRSILLYRSTEEDEKKSWEYFVKHSDKGYSFVDCLSFVVMKKLNVREALSFDKHFRQSGFQVFPN
jgi:predicted nucleic acid-binding protein